MKFLSLILVTVFVALSANFVISYAQTPTVVISPTPVASSTPIPTQPIPAAPTGVKATAIDSDRIDITWQKVDGATSYEVYRNDELILFIEALFYSDTGLEPGRSYSYKVRAFNGSNYSDFSTIVSRTTPELESTTVPEATISPDEGTETTPNVEENFSFVTIGDATYGYSEIPSFEAGEEFTIFGRTASGADIEIAVSAVANSFFAKANNDGFWEVVVDTSNFDPGKYTFVITISAEDYPEDYTSESYQFEVIESQQEVVEEENTFGTDLSRNITIAIIVIVLLMGVAILVAYKKGWLKKASGKDDGKDTNPDTSSSEATQKSLENMIQVDGPTEAEASTEQAPATAAENVQPEPELPEEMRLDTDDFSNFMDKQPMSNIPSVETGPTTPEEEEIPEIEIPSDVKIEIPNSAEVPETADLTETAPETVDEKVLQEPSVSEEPAVMGPPEEVDDNNSFTMTDISSTTASNNEASEMTSAVNKAPQDSVVNPNSEEANPTQPQEMKGPEF